jgi:hypothetical protein
MTVQTWKARFLSVTILVVTFLVLPGAGVLNAQSLPSWADSRDTRRVATERSSSRYEHRGHRSDRTGHSDARWGTSSERRGGGFRTRAPGGGKGPPQECSTSRDCSGYPNEYCGTNGKCFSNGSGPGNQNGGGQQPSDVPIGGHGLWLVLLGLGYGMRRLW